MSEYKNYILNINEAISSEINFSNKHLHDLIVLNKLNIQILDGFIILPEACYTFLSTSKLESRIANLYTTIHFDHIDSVMQVSTHIQKLIIDTEFPKDFTNQLDEHYRKYNGFFKRSTLIVNNKQKISNFTDLLKNVKLLWIERFKPENIIKYKNFDRNWLSSIDPILIQKDYTKNKYGTFNTNNLIKINSDKISLHEAKNLSEIGNIIKTHFYLPYIVNWVIDRHIPNIVDLRPMTNAQKSYLVLIRHGRSEYNEKGLWAGWDNPPLTKNGIEDIQSAANFIRDIHFDYAYASHLTRHKKTIEILKKELNMNNLKVIENDALLERDYGDLTNKNKWEVKKKYGEEKFLKWRRGWSDQVPNGESLKNVYDRVIPYYRTEILPKLESGKNVLIASSGNCLRALIKYLDRISDKDIIKLEIATGEIYIFRVNEAGEIISKEIRNQHKNIV